MITRAIIEEIDREQHLLRIRIPILDGIGEALGVDVDNLRWAPYLYIPGIYVDYRIGDIVVVGFEDNAYDRPLVLGFLRLSSRLEEDTSRIDVVANRLVSKEEFKSTTDTTIGDITYATIQGALGN